MSALQDDVRFFILVVPQSDQDDVALAPAWSGLGGEGEAGLAGATHRVYPHLLAHLAADVAQPLGAVDALRLQPSVAWARGLGLCLVRRASTEDATASLDAQPPKRERTQHAQHLRVLCAGGGG